MIDPERREDGTADGGADGAAPERLVRLDACAREALRMTLSPRGDAASGDPEAGRRGTVGATGGDAQRR